MEKSEIVRKIQLAEAKKWEEVKKKERLYNLMNETDDQSQWQEIHKKSFDRCVGEWAVISELVKSLGIKQLTPSERQIAKQNNEI